MARYAGSSDNMDYVYFAQKYEKRADKDGKIYETTFYRGPYMTLNPARSEANKFNRASKQLEDSGKLGPNSTPDYYGTVHIERRATVVRSKINLEEESSWQ